MSFIGAFLGLKRLHSRPSLYSEAEHLTRQHTRQNERDPVVRCINDLEHRYKEVVGIRTISPQACPLVALVSLTSRECTAEGVIIEAAVEKSNSARMRSWNLLYSSTILFYTSAPISSESCNIPGQEEPIPEQSRHLVNISSDPQSNYPILPLQNL